MSVKQPCISCGEPTDNGTRCPDCAKRAERQRLRPGHGSKKSAPKARGYDEAWRRLSARARRLQPFCSDCGATDDLQADHSPEAWRRHERGLPIRLRDIDVVCGRCNRARGAARGARSRSKASKNPKRPTTLGTNKSRLDGNLDTLGGVPSPPDAPPLPGANSPCVLTGGAGR